jgi:hypothetical protein
MRGAVERVSRSPSSELSPREAHSLRPGPAGIVLKRAFTPAAPRRWAPCESSPSPSHPPLRQQWRARFSRPRLHMRNDG